MKHVLGTAQGPIQRPPIILFKHKMKLKSLKSVHRANGTTVASCMKASQARNGPDPGIMAKGLVDEDLASRSASGELRY